MNDDIVLEELLNEEEKDAEVDVTVDISHSLSLYASELKQATSYLSKLKGLERKIAYDREVIKLVEKWKSTTGFDVKTIKSHLEAVELDATVGLDTKELYTFRDIMDLPRSNSAYIVPRLFKSAGMYVIYADPKVGKTTFMYDFLYGLTVSGEFLGYPCRKSKVVFYQLEEPISNVRGTMAKRGFFDNKSATTLLRNTDLLQIRRSLSIQDDREKLSKMIEEEKPSVLIIDSLRKATYTSGVSENTAEFTSLLYLIADIAIRHDILVIVIHHANKSGRLAGNNGIGGASDGTFYMSALKEDGKKKVLLESNPRGGVPISLVLTKTVSEGDRWKVIIERDNLVLPEVNELEEKIIRFLSNSPDTKYLKSDLSRGVGTFNEDTYFNEALINLQEAEVILSDLDENKSFYYYLPSDSLWLAVDTSISKFITREVKLANKLSQCRTRQDLRKIAKDWPSDLNKKDVFSILDNTERELILQLTKTPPFKENDKALFNNEEVVITECRKNGNLFECLVNNTWISEDDLHPFVDEKKEIEIEEEKAEDSF